MKSILWEEMITHQPYDVTDLKHHKFSRITQYGITFTQQIRIHLQFILPLLLRIIFIPAGKNKHYFNWISYLVAVENGTLKSLSSRQYADVHCSLISIEE